MAVSKIWGIQCGNRCIELGFFHLEKRGGGRCCFSEQHPVGGCKDSRNIFLRIHKDRTIGSSHKIKNRKLQRYKKSLLSFREVICWHGVPEGQ